jgi:hypothetical protein
MRAWLETLARQGVAQRGRTNIGYRVMQAGLTQWVHGNGDETMTGAEFSARFPIGEDRAAAWDSWPVVGEALTDHGRDALRRAREADALAAAADLVILWKSQRIEGLPRAERNAAIEETRGRLIQAMDALNDRLEEPSAPTPSPPTRHDGSRAAGRRGACPEAGEAQGAEPLAQLGATADGR